MLEQAAGLWERGVDLCNTLGGIRKDLENALDNPADPASAAKFNNAAMNSQQWAGTLNGMQAEIVALQKQIDPMPHLPPHPRQQDKPSSAWDWSNLTLGRRTDAFFRNVAKEARDSTTRAFAFGVLSGYGGNAAGSAYLGHSTGGPVARTVIATDWRATRPGAGWARIIRGLARRDCGSNRCGSNCSTTREES